MGYDGSTEIFFGKQITMKTKEKEKKREELHALIDEREAILRNLEEVKRYGPAVCKDEPRNGSFFFSKNIRTELYPSVAKLTQNILNRKLRSVRARIGRIKI